MSSVLSSYLWGKIPNGGRGVGVYPSPSAYLPSRDPYQFWDILFIICLIKRFGLGVGLFYGTFWRCFHFPYQERV